MSKKKTSLIPKEKKRVENSLPIFRNPPPPPPKKKSGDSSSKGNN
jgi:hypothetical protein